MDSVIILLICFWINIQAAAAISCLGIFLVEFMEYFDAPKAAVTWLAGTHMGVSTIVGPVVGILLARFGSRSVGMVFASLSGSGYVLAAFINNLTSLYFTFGLLAGMGPCCYYAIANTTVQRYFVKRRALASAGVLTAFSIGGFAWPPFCRWLISIYSWQGALLILGALHVQLFVAFMLLDIIEKRTTEHLVDSEKIDSLIAENQGNVLIGNNVEIQNLTVSHIEENIQKHKPKICRLLSTWSCQAIIYSIGVCFGMILHAGVVVYTPVRSWQLDISKNEGAILVSIISAAGGLCRIPAGLLGDVPCMNRTLMVATSIIVCGVLAFLSKYFTSFTALALFSALYGCCIAVYLALQTVGLSDLTGMKHLPMAMGFLLAGHGLSSLLLHPIAGLLMDRSGSANAVFITIGFVGIAGGCLLIFVALLHHFNKRWLPMYAINSNDKNEGVLYHLQDARTVSKDIK